MTTHTTSFANVVDLRARDVTRLAVLLTVLLTGCNSNDAREPMREHPNQPGEDSAMSPEQTQLFVDRFTTAWRTRRNEDFEAIWHPHGRLVYPFASRVIKGNEIGLLNDITKKNAPDLQWRALGWTARGNTIAVEWESSNRYGERTFTWRGVDKLTIVDGRIIEEVVYTDTAPFQALRRGETFAPLIPFPDPVE